MRVDTAVLNPTGETRLEVQYSGPRSLDLRILLLTLDIKVVLVFVPLSELMSSSFRSRKSSSESKVNILLGRANEGALSKDRRKSRKIYPVTRQSTSPKTLSIQ